MVGWRLLSYAIKKGLERFGLQFESDAYKNLRCGIFFGAVQAGVSLPDADNIDPSASESRGLRSVAYLHGFDGQYWARCRVDSAYWLKVRQRHGYEHKRSAGSNISVDPGATATLLDVAGHGLHMACRFYLSGVSKDKISIYMEHDGDYANPLDATKLSVLLEGLASGEESVVRRVWARTVDDSNMVYDVGVRPEPPYFNATLTVSVENYDSANALTLNYAVHYTLSTSSSHLKFVLVERDIAELDPLMIALEAEDMLGLTRSSPRPLITTILAKESLEEGQPAVNTMELVLDRDYDDQSLEELIGYVERKYKAKLIARW